MKIFKLFIVFLIMDHFLFAQEAEPNEKLKKYDHYLIFTADKKNFTHPHHQYKKIISILSSRYGCFATRRWKNEKDFAFLCQDGRKIVFNIIENNSLWGFYSSQYDPMGKKLVVNQGRIDYLGKEDEFSKTFMRVGH